MSFISTSKSLSQVRGTRKWMGNIDLIVDSDPSEVYKYVNSGVWATKPLDKSNIVFESLFDKDDDPSTLFQQGRRFALTHLNMPANCLNQPAHCHPGGEFAYVADGSYFDADISGKPIAEYIRGSTVVYRKGSTHRPLSSEGADLVYIAFDGIVFGKNPNDLIEKMDKIKTAEEAIEYAATWMIPDRGERRAVLDRVIASKLG